MESLARIALTVAICSAACGADLLDEVRRGEELAKGGKAKVNAAEIKRLLADLAKEQPDGRLYAGLLQVRLAAVDGKLDQAKHSMDALLPKGGIEGLTNDEQLAYADTLRAIGAGTDAMAIADRLGGAREGLPRVRAAEMMGDLSADHQRWQEAVDWLGSAIKGFDALGSGSSDHPDYAYREALVAKQAGYRQSLDLMTHGLGFVLYEQANRQRFGKKYAESLATYDRLLALHRKNQGKPIISVTGMDDPRITDLPIHDLYAAASTVYRAEALLDAMRYKEAIQALGPVVQDVAHPYRGEAMRLLGDIMLESDGDAAAAERQYTAAIAVLGDAEAQARSVDKYHVPGVSVERTKPPAEMRSFQGWGNLTWFKPEPHQVVNAETCSWYVGLPGHAGAVEAVVLPLPAA